MTPQNFNYTMNSDELITNPRLFNLEYLVDTGNYNFLFNTKESQKILLKGLVKSYLNTNNKILKNVMANLFSDDALEAVFNHYGIEYTTQNIFKDDINTYSSLDELLGADSNLYRRREFFIDYLLDYNMDTLFTEVLDNIDWRNHSEVNVDVEVYLYDKYIYQNYEFIPDLLSNVTRCGMIEDNGSVIWEEGTPDSFLDNSNHLETPDIYTKDYVHNMYIKKSDVRKYFNSIMQDDYLGRDVTNSWFSITSENEDPVTKRKLGEAMLKAGVINKTTFEARAYPYTLKNILTYLFQINTDYLRNITNGETIVENFSITIFRYDMHTKELPYEGEPDTRYITMEEMKLLVSNIEYYNLIRMVKSTDPHYIKNPTYTEWAIV